MFRFVPPLPGKGFPFYTPLCYGKLTTELHPEMIPKPHKSVPYRSRRPLIVTTNLTLQQIQNPTDTAYARIYDRLLEMCAPVRFTGGNFRRETAQAKLERLKNLMNE